MRFAPRNEDVNFDVPVARLAFYDASAGLHPALAECRPFRAPARSSYNLQRTYYWFLLISSYDLHLTSYILECHSGVSGLREPGDIYSAQDTTNKANFCCIFRVDIARYDSGLVK